MQTQPRFARLRLPVCALLVALIVIANVTAARAAEVGGWQSADAVRQVMQQAQVAFVAGDQATAARAVAQATEIYQNQLAPLVRGAAPDADRAASAALTTLTDAVSGGDAAAFASGYGSLWTALLRIGFDQTVAALQQGNIDAARQWLLLREFRPASRFVRPNTDATRALADARAGQLPVADALAAARADLLDTYQSKLNEALRNLAQADARQLAASRAEHAALADGYFAMLAPFYAEQRGDTALAATQRVFVALRDTARAGQSVAALLPPIDAALRGFRAAPLSPAEQARRAGQMVRFLGLVPVEYARGVSAGRVTIDLEIQEAITFRTGAVAAFTDLRSLLDARDAARPEQIAAQFAALDHQLAAAQARTSGASADDIQAATDQLTALLQEVMPAEWQKRDNSADFDVIASALDQMEAAVAAGQYDLAESARLEAYAILESGPEAKLTVFAPQFKPILEGLFWYGQGDTKGLADLLAQHAPAAEIKATRRALDQQLAAAQQSLAGNNAPAAVATNAAVIVFREGLEAVLILASLMGSLKIGEQRRFRKPLWWGAALAFVVTVLTWLLARGVLVSLARYGERLEAIVSLIAIGVLLLITNWFFHSVYWTGWMANFHHHKKRLIGGVAGQFLGLVMLGFTSIYREGFETVLFLQALVLEANTATVLGGVTIGLGATLLLGLLVFMVQAKLPHKKMLIVTGILIGVVLLQMVGKTVNVMQVIGWIPIHPIRWLSLPYWAGMWFGLYATWEGILLQVAAGTFVIGSYFLAERRKHHPAAKPRTAMQPSKAW